MVPVFHPNIFIFFFYFYTQPIILDVQRAPSESLRLTTFDMPLQIISICVLSVSSLWNPGFSVVLSILCFSFIFTQELNAYDIPILHKLWYTYKDANTIDWQ